MATNKRRRVDDDENNATAAANGPPGAPTTPATTNSGGTPGLKGSKPGDSSGSEEGTLNGEKRNDGSGAANKKRKLAWSAEAMALGYETGTIKNSAYVLLAQSGATGMTVAAIVDAATKRGLYSWGTCKTPNNSVTAALSQDTTFVRIAPSTYALRSTLKGGAGPVPQPRTSSGSINSGLAGGAASGSGLGGGAVAGGRWTLGQKAISSKARRVDRVAQQMRSERRVVMDRGAADGDVSDGGGGFGDGDGGFGGGGFRETRRAIGRGGYGAYEGGGGYAHCVFESGYGVSGANAFDGSNMDARTFSGYDLKRRGGDHGLQASKVSSALRLESFRRRTDVLDGLTGDWSDDDRFCSNAAFAVVPSHSRPAHDMEEATAGSSLLWYPSANPYAPPAEKPSPMREPTEALMRASSWKDEARSLFSSPGLGDFERDTGLSAVPGGHLPRWVLDSFSFDDGKGSPGAIAC